ncbi:MAG: hypothetical protein R6V10_02075 [bacterium]
MSFEAECPVCDAIIPLEENEVRAGEIVYCSFCMAPLMITREMMEGTEEEDGKPKKVEVEEDWEG